MKTLSDPEVKKELLERIRRLQPESPRRWGKMTAEQMVCHLNDAYLLAMGERTASEASNFFSRTVVKLVALRAPISWPHGVATRPEMDQQGGGTPPQEFAADVAQLNTVIERFCTGQRDLPFALHPIFGEMSKWEWMRWGYLHADHHLRQFGC